MINPFAHLLHDPRVELLRQISPKKNLFFLVGGALRDAVIGKKSNDLDFSTPLRAIEIQQMMAQSDFKVIPTGISFETITVILGEDLPPIQISSFRGNGTSLHEDLSLRDFSINSLALSIDDDKLIDPQNGLQDIQSKLVRANGNPEARFREDPLRILRLVRIASELNFGIDDATKLAAKELSQLLKNVSVERITDEFIKILISPNFREAFAFLKQADFFAHYLPEFETCIDFEQNEFHKHDVFEHTLDVIEGCERDKLLRLSALFHDIGKPPSLTVDELGRRHFYLHEKIGAEMMPNIAKRIRLPNELTKAIQILVLTHMRPIDCGDSGLRRIIRDTDPYYEPWRALKWSDTASVLGDTKTVREAFKIFDKRISDVRQKAQYSPFQSLAIKGQDLKDLGLVPGPKFKDILTSLSEKVIENPDLNNRESLISIIKNDFLAHI